MKSAAADIVGRTVTGIVVKEDKRGHPHTQVFLLFHDGTYYEFYSDSTIQGGPAGVDPGGLPAVLKYMSDADRWPVFGHVADPAENTGLQYLVALGQIVAQLRSDPISVSALVAVVALARDTGHDHAALSSRALAYRPSEGPRAPRVEEIVSLVKKQPPLVGRGVVR